MKHRQREEEEGDEVWPATPKHAMSEKTKEEIAFCAGLDCSGEKEDLAW